jgi:hypothetical protein
MQAYPISPSPDHKCMVYRLSCRTPREMQMVSFLAGIAMSQKEHFVKIFPWESGCKDNVYHYVSLSFQGEAPRMLLPTLARRAPTVCGWMTVLVNGQSAYISEITTRHATDASFRRVGSLLKDALEYDIRQGLVGPSIQYASLYPLDEDAEKAYVRWGFQRLHPQVKELYKVFGKPPSPNHLESIVKSRKKDGNMEDKVLEEIKQQLSRGMRQRVSTRLQQDPVYRFELLALYQLAEEEGSDLAALVAESL